MASSTGVSAEIHSIQSISGNQPRIRRLPEAATQTWLPGTPLALNASGFVIPVASPIATFTNTQGAIIGLAKEASASLATAGVPLQQTFGSVPNEASAVNISRPYFNDGLTGVEVADQDTIFLAQVGTTVTQANVGLAYGMTKDTDNHWYVDLAKSTFGTNTVCIIVKIDPNDQSASPRGVYIRFVAGQVQTVA